MLTALALASAIYAHSGDTYSSIAAQTGVSVSALEAANGYSPTDIPVGAHISVPGSSYSSNSGTSYSHSSESYSPSHSYKTTTPVSYGSAYHSSASSSSSSGGSVSHSGTEGCIVSHESSGNPDASNGSHYGLYQMTPDLWKLGGGSGSSAAGASASEQHSVYQNIVSHDINGGLSNWTQYDGC